MSQWNTIASEESIEKTVAALKNNGINAIVVASKEEAKAKVAQLIPQKSEVMTMTSKTLEETGIEALINTSGQYNGMKPKLYALDRATQGKQMQQMGATSDYSIGSVHAVTEDGKIVIASATGSQIPGYAYGSSRVVFVVGAQKLVKSLDDALKRVDEYVLPLESERAKKAYGVLGSVVAKLLIINKEVNSERITMVIVKESLGF
jgi:LUD domain